MTQVNLNCDVCNKRPMIGAFCIPGLPMSCAYCQECFDANAHPMGILVSMTATTGSLEAFDHFWVKMVEDTCKHLGVSMEEFMERVREEKVNQEIAAIDPWQNGEVEKRLSAFLVNKGITASASRQVAKAFASSGATAKLPSVEGYADDIVVSFVNEWQESMGGSI